MKITITIETDRRPNFRDDYELWLWNKRKQRYLDHEEPEEAPADWLVRLQEMGATWSAAE